MQALIGIAVGYQNVPTPKGKNWIVNTFAEVGKDLDKATLAAIKPNMDFEFGSDFIQFFDAQGGNAGKFTYIPEPPDTGFDPGWYDFEKLQKDELDCQNGKVVESGTGFMFYNVSASAGINLTIPSAL